MSYDTSWDKPHEPGKDIHWQESDCYWFYDAVCGVGGFHRIGQRPNQKTGQIILFVFKVGGQRFLISHGAGAEVELGADARQESKQVVGSHSVEALGDGRMRYIWSENGCGGDLEFYDSFYTPRNWSKTGHSDDFMSNINSDGHLECSGRLRGKISIGDDLFEIDGLCHRDRSWGFRDNSRASLHRYRMFSGTVGPELSFATFLLDLKDGTRMVAGFVDRNGTDQDVRDLRVLTTFDADGLTILNATGILTLDNGDEIRIESTSLQGFVSPVPEANAAVLDQISTFEWEGRTGFLDIEYCNNPGRGTYIPRQSDLTFSAFDEGLTPASIYKR